MRTLHVTIQLGLGQEDDGGFDGFEAEDIHNALCKAFPYSYSHEIAVCEITPADIVAAIERALDDGTLGDGMLLKPKPRGGGDPA